MLLVSADADVKRACEQWRTPLPLTRPWGQLLQTLFTFDLDDSDATVTRLIVGYLRERLSRDPSSPCGFTLVADPHQLVALAGETLASMLGSDWNRYLISAELTHLNQLIGLTDVVVQTPDPAFGRVPSRPVTHTALARVFFLGTVELLYHVRGRDRFHSRREDDVLVWADLAFDIQDGGVVIGVESRREAAVGRPRWFDEPADALQEVCEALSTVPLVNFPSNWPDGQDHVELETPAGVAVYAELEQRVPRCGNWPARCWAGLALQAESWTSESRGKLTMSALSRCPSPAASNGCSRRPRNCFRSWQATWTSTARASRAATGWSFMAEPCG
ncbi:hypothetical protein [Nonomuraea bangladeshensis]|uniref:hypothetical protein n=1 Tax=Nonomuraea bangladeshensis TaxID=404385 RepID=UPI003C2FB916